MQRQQSSIRPGATTSRPGETARHAEEGTVWAPVQGGDYLASVIVPRAASSRDITTLETAMQGLAPDARHPVALELVATATSRQFLLRATSAMSQKHLCDQVQARYPQALIRQFVQQDDPLLLHEGEVVSAVELSAGAAAYLPLRGWRERELLQEGADPLLGILGVFNHLPPAMRVVAQLALIPAPPEWSQPYRRKAVEHPLEPERWRARRELSGAQRSAPSTFQLVGIGMLVALLLVWWRFQGQLDRLIPSWLLQAGSSLLHGKMPQLSSAHLAQLAFGGILALVLLFCLAFVVLQIRSRLGGTPLYDMRLVEEKTARPAYRVRLRLFAFSMESPMMPTHCVSPVKAFVQCLSQQPLTWSALVDGYRNIRDTRGREKQLRQERADVLGHLVAAYRQYHTASGGSAVRAPVEPTAECASRRSGR